MSDKLSTIVLNDADNVGVSLIDIRAGQTLNTGDLMAVQDIPAGHKFALRRIETGHPFIKYGQVIGFATGVVAPGEHVHDHNLGMKDFDRDYAIGADVVETKLIPESRQATFQGYVRDDGRVGTRNYVGVLPTVNCSASVARFIADTVNRELLDQFPQVDGVVALSHGSGCCLTPGGEGLLYLRRALAGYARNPNFGAVLLVGLGCEVNLVDTLMDSMQMTLGPRLRALNIQSVGGTRATIAAGVDAFAGMLPEVNAARRQPVSAEHLVVGLECGGSDAYSGITANPALGVAVDHLVRQGGTAILSETPEIYGAEHLLTRRAATPQVAEKLIDRIHWWEDYTARMGGEINNNPTPGNKAGGLTSILEKSLGAVAKAGTTDLMAVYGYADPVTTRGMVFMDTPGYDIASITGMVAGGANMICFTTGRGTVCGFKPVPALKLASNSRMYNRMSEDMDVNCGRILDGDKSLTEMGADIFHLILETASGKKTASELLGFGDMEFVPWHIGAVM